MTAASTDVVTVPTVTDYGSSTADVPISSIIRSHEFEYLIPRPTEAQMATLSADIEAHGIEIPLTVDQNNTLVDGYARLSIAQSLGIPFVPVRRKAFSDPMSETEFIISANVQRRHLSDAQLAAVASSLMEIERERSHQAQVEAGRTYGRGKDSIGKELPNLSPPDDRKTLARVGRKIGRSREWCRQALAVTEAARTDPVIARKLALVDKGVSTITSVFKARRDAETLRKQRVHAEAAQASYGGHIEGVSDNHGIYLGDFEEVLYPHVPPSVDLIITDPPYDEASLPLYEKLAEFAARKLRPGGLCMAYAGAMFLPEIIRRMEKHLTWYWMFNTVIPYAQARVRNRRIIEAVRPVVVFSKDPPAQSKHPFVVSAVESDRRAKTHFEWEQSLAPALYWISKLTPNNAYVIDPFAGTGTFLIAAQMLGRPAIGSEIDPGRAAIARKRLASLSGSTCSVISDEPESDIARATRLAKEFAEFEKGR